MARKKKPFLAGDIVAFEYYGNTVVGLLTSPDANRLSVAYGFWQDDSDFGNLDVEHFNVTIPVADIDNFRHAESFQHYRFCRLFFGNYIKSQKKANVDVAILKDDIAQLKEHNDQLAKQNRDLWSSHLDLCKQLDKEDKSRIFALYRTPKFPFISFKPYA